jgi:hypothetical protein
MQYPISHFYTDCMITSESVRISTGCFPQKSDHYRNQVFCCQTCVVIFRLFFCIRKRLSFGYEGDQIRSRKVRSGLYRAMLASRQVVQIGKLQEKDAL